MNSDILQIDVDKVLQSKAPALAAKLPRFLVGFLKKVIHQEGINEFLRDAGNRKGVNFASYMIKYWKVTFNIKGLDKLPKDKKYIFVSNHPLGGLDGVALTSIVGEHFDHQVRFVVNDILMAIKNFEPVFVPVNKHGAQSKGSIDILNEVYNSDLQVLYFPSGLVSRWQKGHIEDLEWKKSFIAKAIKHERDIVPIHFGGKNSNFFYAFAYFRKLIGIKVNLEMLLLPRELFKQKGKNLTIRFGEPISWQTFDKSQPLHVWAEKVKKATYALGNRQK